MAVTAWLAQGVKNHELDSVHSCKLRSSAKLMAVLCSDSVGVFSLALTSDDKISIKKKREGEQGMGSFRINL